MGRACFVFYIRLHHHTQQYCYTLDILRTQHIFTHIYAKEKQIPLYGKPQYGCAHLGGIQLPNTRLREVNNGPHNCMAYSFAVFAHALLQHTYAEWLAIRMY